MTRTRTLLAAMFVAGMEVGLYGFINDKNGKYAEFGEAKSENKHLGAAGLSVAFAGGALMFFGSRQGSLKAAPSIAVGPHGPLGAPDPRTRGAWAEGQ